MKYMLYSGYRLYWNHHSAGPIYSYTSYNTEQHKLCN